MTAGRRQQAERRGRFGEWLTGWLLRLKGYRILGHRVRTHAGEIDLIAKAPGGPICFIEVKARPSTAEAVFSVSHWQKSRIMRAAELYLAQRPELAARGVRYDIVAVTPRRLPQHLPDAFRPGD